MTSLGYSLKLDLLSCLGDWKNLANDLVFSGCWFKLLSSGIVDLTLLGLAFTSWEKDELALVGVKSCDVQLQLFFAHAWPSVVYRDANTSCECSWQASVLQFSQWEPFSEADFASVLSSCGRDNRSELVKGSWEGGCSLLDPILVSAGLVGRLIEVSLYSVNPVFA